MTDFYPHSWMTVAKFWGWHFFRCRKCEDYVMTRNPASKFLSEQSCPHE